MGNAVIFAGSDVKTLKDNISLNGKTRIATGALNPTSTAVKDPAGSIYLSTLTAKLYVKQDAGSSTNWNEVNTNFIGNKELLSGTINGVNTSFSITLTPLDGTLIVFRNGTAVPESEYSFSHPNVTFTTAPAYGSILEAYYLTGGDPAIFAPQATEEVEYRTVSAGEITAKQLTLAQTPLVANHVIVDVIGGTAQEYSVDFVVSSDILDWDGYGLEGTLIAGSKLRIKYYY